MVESLSLQKIIGSEDNTTEELGGMLADSGLPQEAIRTILEGGRVVEVNRKPVFGVFWTADTTSSSFGDIRDRCARGTLVATPWGELIDLRTESPFSSSFKALLYEGIGKGLLTPLYLVLSDVLANPVIQEEIFRSLAIRMVNVRRMYSCILGCWNGRVSELRPLFPLLYSELLLSILEPPLPPTGSFEQDVLSFSAPRTVDNMDGYPWARVVTKRRQSSIWLEDNYLGTYFKQGLDGDPFAFVSVVAAIFANPEIFYSQK